MGVRPLLVVVIVLALLAASRPTVIEASVPSETCARLERATEGFSGRIAYALVALDGSGSGCTKDRDQEFLSASLYKVFVMAAAYQERERGAFSLDERIAVTPEGVTDDPAELRTERAPELVASEAIRLMVQVSDNPAAAALRERLGPATVAAMPVRLGLHDTHLGEQFTTTAGDMARFFELLHAGKVVSPDASRAMVEVLRGEFFTVGLADGMPAGTPFAHKVGYLAGSAHDAGIVSTRQGDYVLVVMTEANEARGEVFVPPTDSGAALDARYVFDLQPSYDLMQSIAAIAFGAFTGRPIPASGTFGSAEADSSPAADGLGGAGRWGLALAGLVVVGVAAAVFARGRSRPQPASSVSSASFEALERAPTSLEMALAAAEEEPLPVEEVAEATRAVPLPVLLPAPMPQANRNAAHVARNDTYAARQDTQFAPRVLATRRDLPMRFGSRNNHNEDAERAEPRVEVRQDMRMARPAPMRTPVPPVTSARLRRIAEYFVAQEELLHEMQRQVEMETAPLAELLVRQQTTMAQTMANLEDRLRPLNEYADAEEANLGALEQRMAGACMDFVARSFSEYLSTQRERIAETRAHIDEQRAPFLRYDEDARSVVEVALSRFDDDMGSLEQNLAEQRRVMLRMLDAMRSESFASAKELLLSREAQMEEMARTGVTDPAGDRVSPPLAALGCERRRGERSRAAGDRRHGHCRSAAQRHEHRPSAGGANRTAAPEPEAPSSGETNEATTA